MPNEKGTTVYTLQKKFQNVFGFTLPLFHGRGLLNCNALPRPFCAHAHTPRRQPRPPAVPPAHRRSQCVPARPFFMPSLRADAAPAVGHPIHVARSDKPTLEEVRRVQTQYIDELLRCVAAATFCAVPG